MANKGAASPAFLQTDNGGLRVSSGTTRVYQHGHAFRLRIAAQAVFFPDRRHLQYLVLDFPRHEHDIHSSLSISKIGRCKLSKLLIRELAPNLLISNQHSGCRHFDTVCQRLPAQVVVDKGRHAANARQAQPDKDKVCRVHKVQGDNLPGFDA